MAYQTNANVLVAIQRETETGTAATDSSGSASQLRITDSPGLELVRAPIQSNEKRTDLLRPMGRLGGKSVTGSHNGELSVGGAVDILIESIVRGTWTAAVAITEATASLTSITTTTSTIVASAGSWITAGVRVGDIVTLTGHATAANNDLRLRVTGVSASTITVAGTPLTADAVADTAFTLTILKKVGSPATPTRYSHTVEQYDADIDLSELFLGCRLIGLSLSFQPNSTATFVATWMGMDRTILATGTSPYFTSPTVTTGLALIADDSAIRYNGTAVATFTGFTLDFQIAAAGLPVIGSFVSPDIFDNDLTVTGSVTGPRSDFSNLTLFDAETEFEVSILLSEPESDPKDCIGIFLPRVKIEKLSAPVGGGDGAKIETRNLMIGPKVAATGYDATIANFFSSAA